VAGPIGSSIVQALLAKHAPVSNLMAPPPAPPAPPPGALDKVGDGGAAMNAVAAQAPTGLQKGLLGRVGDFLHSDEGRAALLRSGAATLQGGLGAGINAGADFMDHRRHERNAMDSAEADRLVRGQQIQNAYNLGLGRLDVDAQNAGESARHNRAVEGNTEYGITSENMRHGTPSGDTRLRTQEDRYEHITPSGSTVATQQGENYRHDNVSADTTATQAGETQRNTADNQTQIMRDRIARAPTVNMHAHYTTTPEEFAKNGPRLRPSQVQPNMSDQGVVSITNDEDYAKLAPGTKFKGPDGQVRVKQ
jgi:hypothetical protein